MIDPRFERELDRREIEDVLRLYCRAIDRLDTDLLKSLYHPDGTDHHGSFSGNAHEFADFIMDRLRRETSYGFHTVTHSSVEIDGTAAAAESYYIGYHRVPGGWDSLSHYFGEAYAREAEALGTLTIEHEYECGGRYIDRFAKRCGAWKILARRITNEWSRCGPTSRVVDDGELAHYNLPGARDRSDPVYVNALGYRDVST
jgi:hypothetical protein